MWPFTSKPKAPPAPPKYITTGKAELAYVTLSNGSHRVISSFDARHIKEMLDKPGYGTMEVVTYVTPSLFSYLENSSLTYLLSGYMISAFIALSVQQVVEIGPPFLGDIVEPNAAYDEWLKANR